MDGLVNWNTILAQKGHTYLARHMSIKSYIFFVSIFTQFSIYKIFPTSTGVRLNKTFTVSMVSVHFGKIRVKNEESSH